MLCALKEIKLPQCSAHDLQQAMSEAEGKSEPRSPSAQPSVSPTPAFSYFLAVAEQAQLDSFKEMI